MVQFGSGYWQPMDREYFASGESRSDPDGRSTGDVNVSIGEIGASLGLGPVPNVQAVGAKLRAGTKTFELGFFGAGKGSAQGHTPEFYGQKQRQALSELSKANRVNFTTHATVGVQGLAGSGQQGFSKTQKEFSISEIRRAIDFAADVSKGGTVVVHTGEFQRPLADSDWNNQDDKYKGKFKAYADEENRSTFMIVDDRTGNIVQDAKKNREVPKPVWKQYNEKDEFWTKKGGKEYTDDNGKTVTPGEYIDLWGNKVDRGHRVPIFNPKTNQFEIRTMGWEELKQEAEEMTKLAREDWNKYKDKSEKEKQNSIWYNRFKDAKSINEIKVRPEEAYVIAGLETTAANNRGWAMREAGQYEESIEAIKSLSDQKKRLEDGTEKKRINDEIANLQEQLQNAQTNEEKTRKSYELYEKQKEKSQIENPTPFINQIQSKIDRTKRELLRSQEAASSQWAQARDAEEQMRHVVTAETYALKESFDGYSDAAMTAYRKTQQLAQQGKLVKPLAVAMENLFPESYGSHPDELMNLVKGSRERMAEKLVNQFHMDKDTAKQTAEKHIVATFDTGHLNIWRKHWQGSPEKTIEQNDKEFEGWMLDKVKKLVENKIIGHIHLADNFGYQDDHIAPGDGNTPIREIIKILKENNYKGEMIVEPGADYYTDHSGFSSVMKTWRHLGSGMGGYGTGGSAGGGSAKRSWSQVGYGYFGQNQPPYFTFGGYAPSEDWSLWSGTPLE